MSVTPRKLLIITQKVDRNDPVLGFFHEWVVAFAKRFESVSVICLEKGMCALPQNVSVQSLGKELKASRMMYILNFYRLILRERRGYDVVFVHMNQEYVLLGGLLWMLMGKRVILWRNHKQGSALTWISVMLSHNVFCTSPQSYTARFRKTTLMPVGIDLTLFRNDAGTPRKKHSILCLGRIAPVKRIELLIEAVALLEKAARLDDVSVSIVGSSLPSDAAYERSLKERAGGLKKGSISFLPAVTQVEAAELFNRHEIYVNMTQGGSMDKTIFEAAVCGALPVVSNTALKDFVGEDLFFDEGDARSLARALERALLMPEADRGALVERLSRAVRAEHSLESLVSKFDSFL